MSTAIVSPFFNDYSNSAMYGKNNGSSYAGSRSGFASPLDHRKPPPSVQHSIVGLRRSTSSVTPTTTSVLRPQSPPKTPLRMTVNGSAVFSATTATSASNTLQREHRKLDRSYSEPVDRRPAGQAAAVQQAPQNSSRYKTELCRPFEESGTCKYGDKCQFAHGGHELRTLARHPKYKTELCRTFHTTGFCPYGPRCHFIHNSEESRKSLINNLNPATGQPNDVTHHQQTRPKALSIGSFGSLGSAGDLSPPSSPLYDDAFGNYPLTPASSTCTTAFAFSHDFASLVTSPSVKTVQSAFPTFGGSQPTLMSSPFSALSIAGSETAFPFPPAQRAIFEGPPSPVDSLGSELDTISGGSPAPGQASCNSPLSRLPIFNQLANPRDGD